MTYAIIAAMLLCLYFICLIIGEHIDSLMFPQARKSLATCRWLLLAAVLLVCTIGFINVLPSL